MKNIITYFALVALLFILGSVIIANASATEEIIIEDSAESLTGEANFVSELLRVLELKKKFPGIFVYDDEYLKEKVIQGGNVHKWYYFGKGETVAISVIGSVVFDILHAQKPVDDPLIIEKDLVGEYDCFVVPDDGMCVRVRLAQNTKEGVYTIRIIPILPKSRKWLTE